MKFWPLNSYYKRSIWKMWLAKSFSEALASKLWNKKKIHAAEAYRNEVKLNYVHPPYSFIKNLWQIHLTDSHMKFTGKINSAIPQQNYMAWLVKNGKTVFSKFTWKISLSVSGEQVSRQASTWPLVFLSQILTFQLFRWLF